MEDQKPMTVVRLDVDSYKRLTAAHVTPTPTGLVLVRGRNEQGKSSLIESMLAALLGKKAKSELPINGDAHTAEVVVDLGGLVVTRKWTRDSAGKAKSTLSIKDAKGRPKRGPQAILDELVGQFADPVAFLGMAAADQVKTVLAVTGLDADLAKLEETAAGWYDRRREIGRETDRLGKALHEITIEVEGFPKIDTDSTIEQLTDDLQAAKESNAEFEAYAAEMRAAEVRGKEAAERMVRLKAEVEKLDWQIGSHRDAWSCAKSARDSLVPVDPEPIVHKLRAHEDASKYRGRRELLAEIEQQYDAASAEMSEAVDGLEEARLGISELLAAAEFPVEGMSYNADAKTLLINSIPFSQASQEQRIKAAASIAMAGDPVIRVMFIREASLIDDENMVLLGELAEDKGFQCWCERVDSNQEGAGIFIEDGEAFQ